MFHVDAALEDSSVIVEQDVKINELDDETVETRVTIEFECLVDVEGVTNCFDVVMAISKVKLGVAFKTFGGYVKDGTLDGTPPVTCAVLYTNPDIDGTAIEKEPSDVSKIVKSGPYITHDSAGIVVITEDAVLEVKYAFDDGICTRMLSRIVDIGMVKVEDGPCVESSSCVDDSLFWSDRLKVEVNDAATDSIALASGLVTCTRSD